ncbi:hypothetical protein BX661DRAFT_183460 [Kickxella alabastrina]|uniref:uncharacterized protein n=1 Tax=Kickxella alabastrina TaxID=61397 RepID=UPI00221E7A6F|nr:uncharacterized protein BX661DRAFT_183460 [Kickxella alabastrina]KAI7826781.1 hypothetical protein BX661DRAFT_183460 [Kickxella alabastrina]
MYSTTFTAFVAAAVSLGMVQTASGYYIPAEFPYVGGNVRAVSNGNTVQAVWGPNGYDAASFGPGSTRICGGSLAPTMFPALPGIIRPVAY